jgi:hypothetical protein
MLTRLQSKKNKNYSNYSNTSKDKQCNYMYMNGTKIYKSLCERPVYMECKCGGGQSCLIDRRWVGDFCHEDVVFNKKNIPLRKSCIEDYTEQQRKAILEDMQGCNSIMFR